MAFFIYYRCMQVVMSALHVCIYWAAEHQAVCSAAFIIPSSRLAKTTASTNAEVSAIGPAYMTPSIPKRKGKMTISGNRKNTCLVRDMITPSLAFPMEVKNPADIGWIPLAKVISMKIRRYFSAN